MTIAIKVLIKALRNALLFRHDPYILRYAGDLSHSNFGPEKSHSDFMVISCCKLLLIFDKLDCHTTVSQVANLLTSPPAIADAGANFHRSHFGFVAHNCAVNTADSIDHKKHSNGKLSLRRTTSTCFRALRLLNNVLS